MIEKLGVHPRSETQWRADMRSYTPGSTWDAEDEAAKQDRIEDLLINPGTGRRVLEIIRTKVDATDPDYSQIVWRYGELVHLGWDLDDPTLISKARLLVEYNSRRLKADTAAAKSVTAMKRAPAGQYVYFMQIRDTIKIGTSNDPVKRCSSLGGDRILAIEPGGYEQEAARHRQFSAYRMNIPGARERFHPSDELMDLIVSIRTNHADIQIG